MTRRNKTSTARFARRISSATAAVIVVAATGCDDAPSPTSTGVPSISIVPTIDNADTSDSEEYCGDPTLDILSRATTTASGDYTVTLNALPPNVASNELFSFSVRLEAAGGIDAGGLDIVVDAGMPQHAHGMTVRPAYHKVDPPGNFEVDGMLFHMPGAWELYVDVVDGPYTERATFYVNAR